MKRFVWLGSVVAIVVLAWSGAWFAASSYIRAGVASLADADGLAAPTLVCGQLGVGGFPFRFDVSCGEVTVVQADLTVTLPELRASVLVYRPTHLLASAKSPLGISDAFTGSSSEIAFSSLSVSASLSGWRIGRVSLVADQVAWSDSLFGGQPLAGAGHIEAHLLDIPEQHQPDQGLAALASYITASGVSAPAFTVAAGIAEIEAEISGVPDDVRRLLAPGLLPNWSTAGGQIKLVSIKAGDGDTAIDGQGTVALDGTGRLEGQVQMTSRGLAERTDGLLDPTFRSVMLGQLGADGAYTQTFAARAGVAFAGLVPIGVVPPLF